MAEKHHIVVAGAGGIGQAVSLMMAEWADFDLEISLGDAHAGRLRAAVDWVTAGLGRDVPVDAFELPYDGTSDSFDRALERGHILLDCLPGSQAPRLARRARENGLHYVNLTEYVAETEQVREIADGADTGFLLQTGLAPGFINVLGVRLFRAFCKRHRVETVDSLAMRVGALPKVARSPHFYGFTWSPVGVATEYLKDSLAVRDFEKKPLPSLSGVETVRLGDLVLEEALTSGGAADLPEALAGRVRHLDYKTFRHPGHWDWVRRTLTTLPRDGARVEALLATMKREIPHVDRDQVVVYAAVEGTDGDGIRHRQEEALVVPPIRIGDHTLRAIQSTTAAGLAESAAFLLREKPSGVVLQSDLDPETWLRGVFIQRAYYEPGRRIV